MYALSSVISIIRIVVLKVNSETGSKGFLSGHVDPSNVYYRILRQNIIIINLKRYPKNI